MYYLQSRYYDPEVGRFVNADAFTSTGQGIIGCNMFVYCGNNPAIYKDRSGNDSEVAWLSSMWWLLFADGVLPFGDLIFCLGFITLCYSTSSTTLLFDYQAVSPIVQSDNTVNASNDSRRPSSKKVNIDMNHIMSGHSADGNRGPNKSRFPKWMTAEIIERAVREAYDNAHKVGKMQFSYSHGREVVKQLFQGKWSQGIIEFWYNYTTHTIETAYPK